MLLFELAVRHITSPIKEALRARPTMPPNVAHLRNRIVSLTADHGKGSRFVTWVTKKYDTRMLTMVYRRTLQLTTRPEETDSLVDPAPRKRGSVATVIWLTITIPWPHEFASTILLGDDSWIVANLPDVRPCTVDTTQSTYKSVRGIQCVKSRYRKYTWCFGLPTAARLRRARSLARRYSALCARHDEAFSDEPLTRKSSAMLCRWRTIRRRHFDSRKIEIYSRTLCKSKGMMVRHEVCCHHWLASTCSQPLGFTGKGKTELPSDRFRPVQQQLFRKLPSGTSRPSYIILSLDFTDCSLQLCLSCALELYGVYMALSATLVLQGSAVLICMQESLMLVARLFGAIAVTIPSCWYLWPAASHAEHHDSHDSHAEETHDDAKEEEEGSTEEQSENTEPPKDDSQSEDEPKEEQSDDKEEDTSEDKSDDKATTKDESSDKDSGEGGSDKTGLGKGKGKDLDDTRKHESSDSKGAAKKRIDSGLGKDLGKGPDFAEQEDDKPTRENSATSKTPQKGENGEISSKQFGLSTTATKHSTQIDEDPEKSKKGEGSPETAKSMGTVSVDRPAK
nr:halomucin [Quercus suber]